MTDLLSLVKRKEWSKVVSRSKLASTDEILYRDPSSFKATALHVAVTANAPVDVVKCLLHHGHQAASMKEKRCGYLPLHCAIRHRSSVEIIALLISHYKNGVSVRDKSRWSSIHLACYFNSSPEVVDLLLKSDPTLAKMRTMQNATALHIACRRKPNSKVVKSLLRLYPEATKERIQGHWLPLHLAVWHDASEETLIDLILADPEATRMVTSSSGQTPLSLYWNNCESPKLRVISLLLDPTILNRDSHGRGDGLIHKLLRFPQSIPNLLTYVLDQFGDDAKCWDDEGRLPLHVAIESQSHVKKDAWKKIFHCYPNAISQRDCQRSLYPFMMASTSSDLDLTFELIRLAPDVL